MRNNSIIRRIRSRLYKIDELTFEIKEYISKLEVNEYKESEQE